MRHTHDQSSSYICSPCFLVSYYSFIIFLAAWSNLSHIFSFKVCLSTNFLLLSPASKQADGFSSLLQLSMLRHRSCPWKWVLADANRGLCWSLLKPVRSQCKSSKSRLPDTEITRGGLLPTPLSSTQLCLVQKRQSTILWHWHGERFGWVQATDPKHEQTQPSIRRLYIGSTMGLKEIVYKENNVYQLVLTVLHSLYYRVVQNWRQFVLKLVQL